MTWQPTTDFEEEIVDLQPDHNFIFGQLSETTAEAFYPRPKAHLDFVAKQKNEKKKRDTNLSSSQNNKLNVIAKVQRIAGTKPLGEQPTIDDWNNDEHVVRETIAMMRHVGMGPSLEEPLDEGCTISTYPITEDIKINRNGRKHMPVFFNDKYFELKPRVTTSLPSSGANSPAGNNSPCGDGSSSSQKSTSIATTYDTCKDQSAELRTNGFESSVDVVEGEESFETAADSESDNIPQSWRNNKCSSNWRKIENDKKTQNWRNPTENNIKTQSWRNSHTKSRNRNSSSHSSCSNWRDGTASPNKRHESTQPPRRAYTPKELYEKKKRQAR